MDVHVEQGIPQYCANSRLLLDLALRRNVRRLVLWLYVTTRLEPAAEFGVLHQQHHALRRRYHQRTCSKVSWFELLARKGFGCSFQEQEHGSNMLRGFSVELAEVGEEPMNQICPHIGSDQASARASVGIELLLMLLW